MEDRIVVAYALIAIVAVAAAYLLTKWRGHVVAERRRLSGRRLTR